MMDYISFFTGIGGMDLDLDLAGMRCVAQAIHSVTKFLQSIGLMFRSLENPSGASFRVTNYFPGHIIVDVAEIPQRCPHWTGLTPRIYQRNAVVPAVAEYIGKCILEFNANMETSNA